jgi:hypothetical protein
MGEDEAGGGREQRVTLRLPATTVESAKELARLQGEPYTWLLRCYFIEPVAMGHGEPLWQRDKARLEEISKY